jgi:hypothetical protein
MAGYKDPHNHLLCLGKWNPGDTLPNDMNETAPTKDLNLRLSARARRYLKRCLDPFVGQMSQKGLATSVTYSGGCSVSDKNGRLLWEYRGPHFLIGGEKPESLREGQFYDLLGFRVWIRDRDAILLKSQTLTTIMYGDPHPDELLVPENASEHFFEEALTRHYRRTMRAA